MNEKHHGYLHAKNSAVECPPFEDLLACVSGGLASDRRSTLNGHLASCPWCSEKVARLNDPAFTKTTPIDPSSGLNRKVRQIWTPNLLNLVWRSSFLWMFLFLASIAASFYDPRHYKQFLVVALVCGIRWALSERAHRHAITITRLDSPDATGRHSTTRPDLSRNKR